MATFAIPDSKVEAPVDDRARLETRSAAGEAAFQSALAALADPMHAGSVASTPLFQACDTVARAMGIALRKPQAGEAQTVEAIAHSSSVRLRRVRLHGAWWERDAGPLLGYRGGRPVALLPLENGGYHVCDPAVAAPELVDEGVAAEIDSGAHIFYG